MLPFIGLVSSSVGIVGRGWRGSPLPNYLFDPASSAKKKFGVSQNPTIFLLSVYYKYAVKVYPKKYILKLKTAKKLADSHESAY